MFPRGTGKRFSCLLDECIFRKIGYLRKKNKINGRPARYQGKVFWLAFYYDEYPLRKSAIRFWGEVYIAEYHYDGRKEDSEKLHQKEIRERQNLICRGMDVYAGSKRLLAETYGSSRCTS